MITRTAWIAGLVALALATASSSVALGTTGYSVKLSPPTPSPVREGTIDFIGVSGDAIEEVSLVVYTARPACLPGWKAEASLAKDGQALLRYRDNYVRGAFSRRVLGIVNNVIGRHHACAYLHLLSGSQNTVAHAAAHWFVESRNAPK